MMKKLLTLGFVLFISILSTNAQERSLSTLLGQLQELGNTTPLSVDEVIKTNFNQNEQTILFDYLENVSNNASTTGTTNILSSEHVFHALNLRGGAQDFGTIEGDVLPFALTTILAPLGVSCFADDFDENGILYGLAYDSDTTTTNLVTVDITDGTTAVIGDISAAIGNGVPTGLAFDFSTSIMYATAGDTLYTIDLTDGTMTLVGAMGTTTGIWIIIDNNGLAYAADIGLDSFYSVDLTTGAATLLGLLGVDISFAQEATVDPATNTAYMAAYTGGGTGGIYSIDVTTGAATLIGDTTPLNAEFGMFSIEGTPPIAAIDDNLLANFTLSPNPASNGRVSIETSIVGEKQVHVFDILGKSVINTVVNRDLDVSSLNQGIYMVQVTQEGATATKKLIIK